MFYKMKERGGEGRGGLRERETYVKSFRERKAGALLHFRRLCKICDKTEVTLTFEIREMKYTFTE